MPTNEQLAAAAYQFLLRVPLKGEEAETLTMVINWLKTFKQENVNEVPTGGAVVSSDRM